MRSLTLRLALLAGLWVAVGLGVAAWFVAGVAVAQIEAALDTRLAALLDAAVGATALDDTGRVAIERPPAGADFDTVFSGAYWQVTGPDGATTTSRSLWDQTLPTTPGRRDAPSQRDAAGPRGDRLRIAERDVLFPGAPGVTHVAVALSCAPTQAEVARLKRGLGLAFGLLGTGLVAGVVLQVVVGLAPLRRARRALAEVRDGSRDALALGAPSEIAPLVAEIDALIAQNRATLERARAHVGNLAHALKTPVAVLRNALAAVPPDLDAARMEAASLERLVQHHLARARSAAVATGAAMPELAPFAVAQEVAAALRRLFAPRRLAIEVLGDRTARLRADPQDVTEMLGNLMENACKWAYVRVAVTIAVEPRGVRITVTDDGPGLPPGMEDAALARGGRLDEAAPGSGLGLAIVADLATLYGGGLRLGRGSRGGLIAELSLPRHGGRAAP